MIKPSGSHLTLSKFAKLMRSVNRLAIVGRSFAGLAPNEPLIETASLEPLTVAALNVLITPALTPSEPLIVVSICTELDSAPLNVPVNVLPIIFALELIFPLAVICPIIFKSSVNEIESLEPPDD